MNVCTVILGAGKGSRMKSITPKPFHKVANLKLIDWVLNTHNSIKIDKKQSIPRNMINYFLNNSAFKYFRVGFISTIIDIIIFLIILNYFHLGVIFSNLISL